jgi:hypothetical protein
MMLKSRENISSCPMLEGFEENWSLHVCLNQYVTTSQACQCLLHFYMMIITINPPTTYQNICFFLFITNHKECNDHVDHHMYSIQRELGRPKFFQAHYFIYLFISSFFFFFLLCVIFVVT